MFTKNFKQITKKDADIAGGKGASLGEMTQAGIPVPPGFVVLAGTFEKFLEETDLNVEVDATLHTVDHNAMHTVENASEKIQTLIKNAKMPENIAREIREKFSELGAKFVAVRSSATAEDGAENAWAGQLDSFLNTTEENLLEKVQHCWASLFTPRAIFYRFEKNLHKQKISVAVVVQKMVESEVSGIAFSVHPVTEDYNQIIIEAGFGLGEAIVSGQITPDSYVVEKNPRNILDINVSTQERGIYRMENGGNEWIEISGDKQGKQKLSKEQILELSEIIIGIEKHYGFPCDIEWAFEDNRFYIVQSRPITTLAPPKNLDVPDFLKAEDYKYTGYYKCPIFANWFWNAWYIDDLAKKAELNIGFPGYVGCAGGHSFIHAETVEKIRELLKEKIENNDLGYFERIVKHADIEFKSAVKFAESFEVDKENLHNDFEKIVKHARRMMFFWCLGWLFSETFTDTLKMAASDQGISESDIHNYIPQLDTPLIRQQSELEKLKKMLDSAGIWDLLKHDSESAIKEINKSPELSTKLNEHIKEYEWIEVINWIGERFTLAKLLDQMTYLNEKKHKKMNIPDPFILYAEVAQRIAYLRQAGSEYSSMFENKTLPVIAAIAEKAKVSARDMLNLLPDEFFEGENISPDIYGKIESRKMDRWFIYSDKESDVKSIENQDVANKLIESFVPAVKNENPFELKGNIGNKGKAKGPVRIIIATDDFHKMQKGDVLVTPMTTPDFILLMQKSAAIITDMGGLLCHAAIVSRELNKPCVIGTNFATQILKDGDLVEVDADKGVVKILERVGN